MIETLAWLFFCLVVFLGVVCIDLLRQIARLTKERDEMFEGWQKAARDIADLRVKYHAEGR